MDLIQFVRSASQWTIDSLNNLSLIHHTIFLLSTVNLILKAKQLRILSKPAALREIMSIENAECRIEIRNFGVFEVKKTKAKPKARNPKTNEVIYVPPRRKTHFKPGKLLQNELKKPL